MFAYCNNNPVNLDDALGHMPSNKDILNPNQMSYGNFDTRFIRVHFLAPDTPIFDAFGEFVQNAISPIMEEGKTLINDFCGLLNGEPIIPTAKSIKANELIDTPNAVYKIYKGSKQMTAGIGLLLLPLPSEIDEIYGVYQVSSGFNKLVHGIGALFNWSEE